MHFRNNKLIFSSSKDVKKEIEKLLGKYTESMNIFPYINDKLEKAIKTAKIIEKIKEYH